MKSPECRLTPTPRALPAAIGFPTADGVFISKGDWAELVARDVEVRAWMSAAADCLRAR